MADIRRRKFIAFLGGMTVAWPLNKVGVIAAMSGDISIRAATTASSTVPVVFITGSDPVQTGLVASLARPGGNVTGFSMVSNELMASANTTAKALNDRGLPSGRGGKWTARSVINVSCSAED